MSLLRRVPRPLAVLAALATSCLTTAAVAVPTLWVGDGDGTLARVDLASGAVSVVGPMARPMSDIAFTVGGELWGVDLDSTLWRIDPRTAASTPVGPLGTTVNALVFDAQGTLYAASDRLWTVDTRTGRAQAVGVSGGFESSGDLAFVAGALYLSASGLHEDRLWRLDATTGQGAAVGSGLGVAAVYGLATDDNVHLYGLTGRSVVQIDPATGTSTQRLSYGPASGLGVAWGTAFTTEALAAVAQPQPALTSAPVPEPPAALLMGLGALWLLRRLRGAAAKVQVPRT